MPHAGRFRTFLFSALLAMATAAAPYSAAEAVRTVKAELPVGPGREIRIENLAGTMTVRPGSGAAVVVTATVHAESEELAGSIRVEQVRGPEGEPTLRVIYPLDKHSTIRYPEGGNSGSSSMSLFGVSFSTSTYGGRRFKVASNRGVLLYADVEVQVPAAGVDATFRNVVGPIRAEGISGKTRFDTDSGDVTLTRMRGDVSCDTGSGAVRVSDVNGSVSCDTGSGDCDISNVRGARILCDTGSGNVTLRAVRVTGEIVADTGSGDVLAEDVDGSLRCDTGSGGCTLTNLRGGKVSCDTGSGNVTLRSITADEIIADTGSGEVLVKGADTATFTADTGSGEVTFESRGIRLTRLVADTGSGDVILRLGANASFHAIVDQGSGDLVNRYDDAQPILEDRVLVGYRRGDGRIRITVGTGSGSLVLEPGAAGATAARQPKQQHH